MTAHPEVVLMLLAAGIYLYDSLILLNRNEALIHKNLFGRWCVVFGSNGWKVRGREPYLPNPLLPHIPQFKLGWRLEGTPKDSPEPLMFKDSMPLSGLAPLILLAGVCLFALLPYGFYTHAGMMFTLPVIAGLYSSVIAALIVVFQRRKALQLTNFQFYAMAFECLACIPLALNLVRRLARRSNAVNLNADLNFTAGKLQLSQQAWDDYQAACAVRIKEEIDFEEEGSVRMKALQGNLNTFSKESSK